MRSKNLMGAVTALALSGASISVALADSVTRLSNADLDGVTAGAIVAGAFAQAASLNNNITYAGTETTATTAWIPSSTGYAPSGTALAVGVSTGWAAGGPSAQMSASTNAVASAPSPQNVGQSYQINWTSPLFVYSHTVAVDVGLPASILTGF